MNNQLICLTFYEMLRKIIVFKHFRLFQKIFIMLHFSKQIILSLNYTIQKVPSYYK